MRALCHVMGEIAADKIILPGRSRRDPDRVINIIRGYNSPAPWGQIGQHPVWAPLAGEDKWYVNRTVKHGKPNQLESGKDDRPLLAGLALCVDVVNERGNVGI